ncbi:MAG TPA: MFS transporter [Sphingomonas sp.]|nr:MFS transporter [Sphingomonas sp.]
MAGISQSGSTGKGGTKFAVGGKQAGALQAHVLLLIACLPILGMLVIAPVLPEMQRYFADVDGVAYLVPLALTAPALVIVLISPFAGRIAARLGRKPTLTISLLLYLVAATAPLYLHSLLSIVLSRLVVGAAEALLMTVSTMLIGDYFESTRRDRYLAYQIVYTSVSAVLFLVIGGMLGEAGWRMPFLAYFVALLLLPFVLILIWEPAGPPHEEAHASSKMPWGQVFPVYLITFFAGGCMNLVAVELGYLIEAVGTNSTTLKGAAAAANSAGIAVGAVVIGIIRVRDRVTQLVASLALGAGGFGMMGLSPNVPGVIMGGALVGLGSGFYLGWLLAAVNRPLSFDTRGRGVGLWMASYFLATVLAPASAVLLSGPFGGLQPAMLAYAGVMGAFALLAPILLRGR